MLDGLVDAFDELLFDLLGVRSLGRAQAVLAVVDLFEERHVDEARVAFVFAEQHEFFELVVLGDADLGEQRAEVFGVQHLRGGVVEAGVEVRVEAEQAFVDLGDDGVDSEVDRAHSVAEALAVDVVSDDLDTAASLEQGHLSLDFLLQLDQRDLGSDQPELVEGLLYDLVEEAFLLEEEPQRLDWDQVSVGDAAAQIAAQVCFVEVELVDELVHEGADGGVEEGVEEADQVVVQDVASAELVDGFDDLDESVERGAGAFFCGAARAGAFGGAVERVFHDLVDLEQQQARLDAVRPALVYELARNALRADALLLHLHDQIAHHEAALGPRGCPLLRPTRCREVHEAPDGGFRLAVDRVQVVEQRQDVDAAVLVLVVAQTEQLHGFPVFGERPERGELRGLQELLLGQQAVVVGVFLEHFGE